MKVSCNQCGKELDKPLSQIKRSTNHFCSSTCSALFQHANKVYIKKDYGNCVVCNQPKQRGSSLYCSLRCQHDKQLEDKIKSGNHSARTAKLYLVKSTDNTCSLCGIKEWQNKPLVKILDHIDGNSDNNNLNNLRLVCSNCDSQLSTYKSKNKGKGRAYRRQRYLDGKSY